MKKAKRIISIILTVMMVLGAVPFAGMTAFAAETYVDRTWDGTKVVETVKEIPAEAQAITSSTTTLYKNWYYVDGNVTFDSRITVDGTSTKPIRIILKDGCYLNAKRGINVANGKMLYIYAQSDETGRLFATGATDGAGIGSMNSKTDCGEIIINGGQINAHAGSLAAGIGGGKVGDGGTVTINGGTVTVRGNGTGAAIGGGNGGDGGTVTINGGTVTATGGTNGSGVGIGGGTGCSSHGTLTVNGKVSIKAGSREATAQETTVEAYTTSRDSYVSIVPKPHVHEFAETWSTSETAHWYACTADDCDITDYATCGIEDAAYAAHTWSDGKCSVCKYECKHNYDNGTCTICGYKCSHNFVKGVCTICGKVYDIAQAKADAIAEIRAAKTEKNAAVAEAGIARINDSSVSTISEVNAIKDEVLTEMMYDKIVIDVNDLEYTMRGNVVINGVEINCCNGADLACFPGKNFRFIGYYSPSFAFALEDGSKIAKVVVNGARHLSGEGWSGCVWTAGGNLQEEVFANATGTDEVTSIEIYYLPIDLDQAKADAIAEINAKKTDDNASIATKAISDITAAEKAVDVKHIKTKALEDMAAADELAQAKKDAIEAVKTRGANVPSTVYQNAIDSINACDEVAYVKYYKRDGFIAIIQYEHPEYPTEEYTFKCDNPDCSGCIHVFSYGECASKEGMVLGVTFEIGYDGNVDYTMTGETVWPYSFKDNNYAPGWYYYDKDNGFRFAHCDGHKEEVDRTELDALLKTITPIYYTAESFAPLAALVEQANGEITTQAQADKLVADIKNAQKNLVIKTYTVTLPSDCSVSYSKTDKTNCYMFATITAPSTKGGQKFAYWVDENGNVASTYRNYSFFSTTPRTFTPVYGEVTEDKYISTKVLGVRDNLDGTYSILVEHSASTRVDINAHGVLFTFDEGSKSDLVFRTSNDSVYNPVAARTYSTRTGLFEVKISKDSIPAGADTIYLKSYVIKTDSETPVYSESVAVSISGSTNSATSFTVDELSTENPSEYEPSPMPDYQLNFFEKVAAFFMSIWKFVASILFK